MRWRSIYLYSEYTGTILDTGDDGFYLYSVYTVEESGSIAHSKHRSSRKLVWERTPPKTETQIQFEKLQQQIADLQAQANKLQATL